MNSKRTAVCGAAVPGGGVGTCSGRAHKSQIGLSSYFLFVIFAQRFKYLLNSYSSNGDPKCLTYSLIPF